MQPNLPLETEHAVEAGEQKRHSRFLPDFPEAELVFGLAYAVGTDYKPVMEYLLDTIKLSGYTVKEYHVSDWFKEISDRASLNLPLPETTELERISSRIEAGNNIRAWSKQADVFALICASKLCTARELDSENNPAAHKRTAHILVSLKRPEEVQTLRKIYGPGFFLIGVVADETERAKFLTSRKGLTPEEATGLIERDQKEKDVEYGQRTRDTFQMADVFVGIAGKQYETGLT